MPRRASPRRHAQAVFQIALERGTLEKWQKDLDAIASAFGNPQFKAVLGSPKIRQEVKFELVKKQLSKVDPLALNLAYLLVSKGRVDIARGTADEFDRMLNAHQGIEMVEVTSAVELDKGARKAIEERLSKASGKKISLTAQVRPAIVGGLVIKIGDQLIDGSTKSKLGELRKELVER